MSYVSPFDRFAILIDYPNGESVLCIGGRHFPEPVLGRRSARKLRFSAVQGLMRMIALSANCFSLITA